MSAKGVGLGKGLDALLGGSAEANREHPAGRSGVETLYLDQIIPNPAQPRTAFDHAELSSLAESIREQGILQPLLVRPDPGGSSNYQIVAGERRWRAAQIAQCHEVPVIIRQLQDNETMEIALVENLQRHDLNPIEEARAYSRLIADFGGTQESIARRIGKSRSYLANTVRLLNLPVEVQNWVETGELQAGHARAVLSSSDPLALAEQVKIKGLSVRQTELLAKRGRLAMKVEGSKKPDADTLNMEKVLTDLFGLSVVIRGSGSSGEIRIRYTSADQIEGLAAKLRGQW